MEMNYEIIVSGRVQGVGFRYYTKKRAFEHNISGFVRNLPDNQVQIVAEGKITDLETFRDHIQMGPPMARVLGISVSKSAYTGSYEGFAIRY